LALASAASAIFALPSNTCFSSIEVDSVVRAAAGVLRILDREVGLSVQDSCLGIVECYLEIKFSMT